MAFMKQCKFCQTPLPPDKEHRTFCNQSCAGKWNFSQPEYRAKIYTPARNAKITQAKIRMHQEHPEYGEAFRRRTLNMAPEMKLSNAQKQKAKLREMGWKPTVRGGNGTGPTHAELILLEMLPGSKNNYPIKTKMGTGTGYPTCYKVDVAVPALKLAIEADGNSHNVTSRKEQDAKKDSFLRGIGWTVLRFKNKQIVEQPETTKALIDTLVVTLTSNA